MAATRVADAACTRLRWAADGRTIAAGDSRGAVHVQRIGASLAEPRAEDASRMAENLWAAGA